MKKIKLKELKAIHLSSHQLITSKLSLGSVSQPKMNILPLPKVHLILSNDITGSYNWGMGLLVTSE